MFFFGGGIFLPLLGVTRAGNLPVFLRVGICLLGSITRIGMVSYAATNKSPKIFLVVSTESLGRAAQTRLGKSDMLLQYGSHGLNRNITITV